MENKNGSELTEIHVGRFELGHLKNTPKKKERWKIIQKKFNVLF